MLRGIAGCPEGVPGVFRNCSVSIPGCSEPVPGFTDTRGWEDVY